MNPNRKIDALEVIKNYLQWWDPICVIEAQIESGTMLDEYDIYAAEIYELLKAKRTAVEIRDVLSDITVNQMGLGSNTDESNDRDMFVAQGLVKCFDTYPVLLT